MPIIGKKTTFAIEYEIVNKALGNFCFWVNDTQLGDYSDLINLWTPKSYLASYLENGSERFFPNSHALSKELVQYALQGWTFEDDPNPISTCLEQYFTKRWMPTNLVQLTNKEKKLYESSYFYHAKLADVFWLEYVGAGAFLDLLQIVLVNEYKCCPPRQRIIWKTYKPEGLFEYFLPPDYFDSCVKQFIVALPAITLELSQAQ